MNVDVSAGETRDHIRGSVVLALGRVVSLLIGTATQVLIVRLLTKGDYGAFAYGLAMVASARVVVSLGHHQVLTRFFALYDERRQYSTLLGAIAMEVTVITTLGMGLFGLVRVFEDQLSGGIIDDRLAVHVLAILILLAPIEALDRVFESIFAVFSRPRAIFVRKYLIAPGLRLGVVIVLLALDASVMSLAIGYVAASAAGTAVYALLAIRFLRERGVFAGVTLASIRLPFREIFGFSIPLLSSEAVTISLNTVSVVLLGYFGSTEEVAGYRAIFPVARLNQFVFFTFALLYVPLIARLFSRHDLAAARSAYWNTTNWLALATFPAFALSVPFAEPTTVALFGEKYRDSAVVLAVLSAAYYANVALGFNALTIQTFGRVSYILKVNVIVAALNVALSMVLASKYLAVGVAVANAVALTTQNVLFQVGLRKTIGTSLIARDTARVLATIVTAAAVLATIELTLHPPWAGCIILAAATGIVLFGVNRSALRIGETFPELRRFPVMSRIVG